MGRRKGTRRHHIDNLKLKAIGIAVENLPGDTSEFQFNFRNEHYQLIFNRIDSAYSILARLVVAECVEVVQDTPVSEHKPLDKEVIAARIRRHFGVDNK